MTPYTLLKAPHVCYPTNVLSGYLSKRGLFPSWFFICLVLCNSKISKDSCIGLSMIWVPFIILPKWKEMSNFLKYI